LWKNRIPLDGMRREQENGEMEKKADGDPSKMTG